MSEILKHISQIKELCYSLKVKTLYAFGSVTSGNFRSDSDIDLIVDIDEEDPIEYSDIYFNLKFSLESLFNREIDLLEQKTMKNSFLRNQIDQTKVMIYGN
jgi:predicted nucleotidyltransferase